MTFPFPFHYSHAENEQPASEEAGTEKVNFVEFTEKEIKQMPAQFRRLILVNRKRCYMRKHASGENTWTYEIRFRKDGYNISASGKTIELAKANMLEKMKTAKPKAATMNGYIAGIPTVFGEFALYYFEKFRQPKITEKTYENDLRRLNNHILPAIGKKELSKITPTDCELIINKLKSAGKGKTADEVRSLLSVTFKGAIAHGIIERNPIAIVPHIKHEHQHGTALTREEESALFEKVNGTPYEILFALILYCGLRPNEVKTATIQGKFIVAVNSKRKNKKIVYKRIPISKRLDVHLKKIGYDLSNAVARAEKTLSCRFPKFCPGHKLYDLRTTFYTRCDELGVAAPARDEFVGHSSGVLTATYRDLSDEYLLKEGKKLNKW